MNNIEIIINKENRMVDLKKSSIGNDGENLQYNLVFSFLNGFVDGQARLEYQINGEKYFAILEKHEETYTMPINSLITKVGKILMQIVITQGTSEEEVPIFKSNVFYMFCNSSINAQTQEPDGYVEWLDIANTKLNELDNINIEATKENGVATITITNKDGSKEIVNLYDAEGAITNYEMLDNKPSINGVELVGDKTLEELNIQEKGDYLTSENDPLFKQSASYGITSQDIENWNNKSEFSGNYDDLNGKPTIPTKTSELTNNSGFISEIPSEYITEEELNNKKYLTSIPSEYVTESELEEKGYLTEHQSLDHLQEKLKSGETIKTINNQSLLGSGNITITGGNGTSDYNALENRPKINDITLSDNKTLDELGIQAKGNYVQETDYATREKAGLIRANLNTNTDVWQDYLYGVVNSYEQYQEKDRTAFVSKGTLDNVLEAKDYQTKLVDGENIKTINGNSILGSGNIEIQGVGGNGADDVPINTIVEYDGEEVPSGWVEIEETHKRNMASLTISSDYTSTNTNWKTIPLDAITIVGDKLSLQDYGIKIGAGVTTIRVSAGFYLMASSSEGDRHFNIWKNNDKTKLNATVTYSHANKHSKLTTGEALATVNEGDIILLGVSLQTNDQLGAGATTLFVEVVE